jgi:hypothetical protein
MPFLARAERAEEQSSLSCESLLSFFPFDVLGLFYYRQYIPKKRRCKKMKKYVTQRKIYITKGSAAALP